MWKKNVQAQMKKKTVWCNNLKDLFIDKIEQCNRKEACEELNKSFGKLAEVNQKC